MSEKLEFDLTVKNNGLSKALDESSKKADELGGVLSTALGVFGGGLALKAFDGVISGFASLIDFSKEAINAAAEQEVATNNLNNALKRTGLFTQETSKALQDYSTQMQASTTFQDDAIQSNIALLASLTSLDANGLKKATSAAADFATVLGVDLETATRLIAKAADGNVSALKRYGVTVEEGASKSETLERVITKLNEKFGGAATSQLNTYSGSLKAVKNAYADMLEPIGDIVVKNPIVIATFNVLKDSLNDANGAIGASNGALKDLVQDGFLFAISAAGVLFDSLDGITKVFKALVATAEIVGNAFDFGLVQPIKLVIDGMIKLGSFIPIVGDAIENLKNPLEGTSNAIRDNLSSAIDDLKNSADDNIFTALSNGADNFAVKVIETSAKIQIANNEANASNETRRKTEEDVDASILEKRRLLQVELSALQAQFAVEDEANRANLATIKETNESERKIQEINNEFAHQAQLLEITTQAELDKASKIKDTKERSLTQQKIIADAELKAIKLQNKQKEDLDKNSATTLLADKQAFYAAATSLQTSSNKELAAIGKAFAIQQATINGYAAIQSSFRFGSEIGGPILGATFAAIAAAATAANVAKIAGVSGFAEGGIIGATTGGDNRIASVRDGELVLNANQQKKLFDAINSGNLGGGDIIVQIDGREVAKAVRNQIQGGFVLA
jgi:hypothetical protein